MYNMEVHSRGIGLIMEKWDLINKEDYFMSCFVVSLKESEIFMMDVAGLQYQIKKVRQGTLSNVAILFLGRFKGFIIN